FSILDPVNVGSLTTSHDATVAYRLSSFLSLHGSYGESTIRTDPGAKIPADSRSRQAGGGIGLELGKIHTLAQFSRSTTHNEFDPRLDFNSRRIDLDLRSSYGRNIYGRFSFAHSERPSGLPAGSDYRAAIGAPLIDSRAWNVSAETGISVMPAGVAQKAVRQSYASLRVNPNRWAWLTGGLQFTYERVKTEEEKFEAFSASISAQKIVRWGEGLMLVPQIETRAMRLMQRRVARTTSARVHIVIFQDTNQNSKLDPGEPPISPAFLDVDGRRYRTTAAGETTAAISAGKHTIRLLPRGAVLEFFVPLVTTDIVAEAGETAEVIFPLRPAGRLGGHLEAQGEMDPGLLANLAVRAVGAVERQSTTDASGTFDFGLLPEGEYVVEIIPEPLREHDLVSVAPTRVTARVSRGRRESVTLRVRKATARERFGT
ncbi:MAG TPA: hypothetical protein VF975_05385, partial [Thermoanaerobaculia bacterium]